MSRLNGAATSRTKSHRPAVLPCSRSAAAMTLTLGVQPAAYLALERWRSRGSMREPPVSAVEPAASEVDVSELSA